MLDEESQGFFEGNFQEEKIDMIYWMWPPHSNSDHQDFYIFSRGPHPNDIPKVYIICTHYILKK